MHAVLSHPDAMRYWSTPPHASLRETREWLSNMISSRPEESADFVIEYQGKAIGKAGCYRLPELGYILHPDYWRRGLAREALTAVIEHLFATSAIPELRADVDPRNAASLKLLAGLGFARTGRGWHSWRVRGEWCDSVYLARASPACRP